MRWRGIASLLMAIPGLLNAQSIAFEVVSVHADTGPFKPPSFPLSSDEAFREPNGRFHADFALPTYIQFAYKISLTGEERRAMLAKLPDWVNTDRFDIEATAPLHATKDQYRLMMQALLAERFGLKLHFEQREMPVLAMVLAKPGKPGQKLTPHVQPCNEGCYLFSAESTKTGLVRFESRATTMDRIAEFLGNTAGATGEIGRRVVDQTGLTGLWDFTLEAAPATQTAATPQDAGPTVLEAIEDQWGIKLKPIRATVSVVIIDHLERPAAN